MLTNPLDFFLFDFFFFLFLSLIPSKMWGKPGAQIVLCEGFGVPWLKYAIYHFPWKDELPTIKDPYDSIPIYLIYIYCLVAQTCYRFLQAVCIFPAIATLSTIVRRMVGLHVKY